MTERKIGINRKKYRDKQKKNGNRRGYSRKMIDWKKYKNKQRKKQKKLDWIDQIQLFKEIQIMETIRKNDELQIISERLTAEILNMSISKLKYLRKQKKIACVQSERSIGYRPSQIIRYIESCTVEAVS